MRVGCFPLCPSGPGGFTQACRPQGTAHTLAGVFPFVSLGARRVHASVSASGYGAPHWWYSQYAQSLRGGRRYFCGRFPNMFAFGASATFVLTHAARPSRIIIGLLGWLLRKFLRTSRSSPETYLGVRRNHRAATLSALEVAPLINRPGD